MIRLIIAGPRDYYDRENVFCHIHMFQGKFGIDEIVSVEHLELIHWRKNMQIYTKFLLSCFLQIGKNTGRRQGLSETNKWLNTAMFYWHLIAERKERKI